ncbi:MAG: type II secretion system protein GspG, partial [Sedimenticola sp.]
RATHTTGKQCGLIANGDYAPSLRSPWRAAPADLVSGARWKEGGYIERVPKDPWGNTYLYLQPGSHGDYDLYSLGADGVGGGTGVNADIGSWNIE